MDAKVAALLKELEKYKKAHPNMWNVPPDTGRLLMILAKVMKAKRILEIGTSNGYSTIHLGLAARETGGKVRTIELEAERARMARENLARAGLSDIVEVIEGKALEVLPRIEGPLDYVFIDAAKSEYVDYFNAVWDKLRPGGLIVADNVVNLGSTLRDYIRMVEELEGAESVIVPIGGGEMVTYKLPG